MEDYLTYSPRKSSSMERTPVKRAGFQAECDRFIPSRPAMDFELSHSYLTQSENDSNFNRANGPQSPMKEEYMSSLADTLLNADLSQESSKILAFKNKAPEPKDGWQNSMRVLYTQNRKREVQRKQKVTRHIPQAPEKILDAPQLLDDYYLNLLDWNQDNILAVALSQTVYLWNASTGEIDQLMQVDGEDYIASVSWIQEGSYLAVGISTGELQLWEVTQKKKVRSMGGHLARVSSLAWNSFILSSGSRDGTIRHNDVRQRDYHIATLEGHTQEVCGLKWSPNGQQLASGGNDDLINIYDARNVTPRHTISHHRSAVRALAWCPWQSNLLASGGGTLDRRMCFWNTQTGSLLQEIDTGSQVCSLVWSKNDREILSSHGFAQNQLSLWKYPSLAKIADLTGHTARVVHLAQSPDGATVVSGAADETLRFWNVFSAGKNAKISDFGSESLPRGMSMMIR